MMLAQWLPETEDKLPANASHQVQSAATAFFICRCFPRRLLSDPDPAAHAAVEETRQQQWLHRDIAMLLLTLCCRTAQPA